MVCILGLVWGVFRRFFGGFFISRGCIFVFVFKLFCYVGVLYIYSSVFMGLVVLS